MQVNSQSTMSFKEKLDNFWYYHKWHTVIALFVILAIVICSFQMCTKESYDIYIMYAGGHEYKRSSANGDVPEYVKAVSSLKQVCSDFDGDGTVSVSFINLYVPSSDEIADAEKNPDKELNYTLIAQDKERLDSNILYSDYYVCIITQDVYNQYKTVQELEMFAPLSQYADKSSELIFYTDSAVYLSSTKLASLPVFSKLPEDTLICLRTKSAIASHFSKEQTEEQYRRSVEVIKNILSK